MVDEAEELIRESIRLIANRKGPRSDTPLYNYFLGYLLTYAKNPREPEEGIKYYKAAYEARVLLNGTNHDLTTNHLAKVSEILAYLGRLDEVWELWNQEEIDQSNPRRWNETGIAFLNQTIELVKRSKHQKLLMLLEAELANAKKNLIAD